MKHTANKTTGQNIVRRSAAGLAGIALAGAGLAAVATPASAAPTSTWDALAKCESTGNWNINTGNGYYGGLQFSVSSWRAAGGSGMPHQASKAEQIRVAENLLAMQGWGAWPACSAKLGLYGKPAQTNVTTKSVERTAQVQKATPAQPAKKAAPVKQAAPAKKAAPVKKAAPAKKAAPVQQAAPAKKAAPAKQAAPAKKAAPVQQAAPQRAAAVAPTVARSGETITVKPGDTLSKLAQAHGIQGGWQTLHGANKDTVANPNLIFVGQTLYLPAK